MQLNTFVFYFFLFYFYFLQRELEKIDWSLTGVCSIEHIAAVTFLA